VSRHQRASEDTHQRVWHQVETFCAPNSLDRVSDFVWVSDSCEFAARPGTALCVSRGLLIERAAKVFHDQYGPLPTRIGASLRQAGGGFGDRKFLEAQQDARQLGDAFDTYGKTLKAIQFPERAKTAADNLTKATEAGKVVMVNAAGFFSKDQMQATLDQYRPQVEAAIDKEEKALRAALK
jgi:hypothetical protein